MNVFWRQKPLAAQQAKLLSLVLDAHGKSAQRGNISTVVLCNAAVGSANYYSSLAAALCSVGATHAPLMQSHLLLANFTEEQIPDLVRHIEMGGKIPGWGNSFVKDGPDEIWKDVAEHISEHWPKMAETIQRITDELHARGKMIYPNPSTWTAAAAIILEIPPPIIGWLFVHGRISAWSQIFMSTLIEQNSSKPKEEELV